MAILSGLVGRFSSLRRRGRWSGTREDGLKVKSYRSYDDYVEHQKCKLSRLDRGWMEERETRFRAALKDRLLREPAAVGAGMSVLCVAARLGAEVLAFKDIGCFAVGIDLNPGSDNIHVLPGDFHKIQFPPHSVDLVFTNSLDHTPQPEVLLGQVAGVLKPGGLFVVEASLGEDEGYSPGSYEALAWRSVDDLLNLIQSGGFEIVHKFVFGGKGIHARLRLKTAGQTAS